MLTKPTAVACDLAEPRAATPISPNGREPAIGLLKSARGGREGEEATSRTPALCLPNVWGLGCGGISSNRGAKRRGDKPLRRQPQALVGQTLTRNMLKLLNEATRKLRSYRRIRSDWPMAVCAIDRSAGKRAVAPSHRHRSKARAMRSGPRREGTGSRRRMGEMVARQRA